MTNFKHKEIFFHILFWSIYFIYPIIKFIGHEHFNFDFVGNVQNLICISISVYTTYFLFDKFFDNKLFIALAICVLLIIILVNCYLHIQDCHCSFKLCFLNKLTEYIFINIFFITFLGYKKNILNQQLFQENEKERIKIELSTLKAQVNPHFLFNTLNMLYAKSMDGDKSLPSKILKLSGNLHYMLHEGNKTLVSIKKELEFIEDYISLQKARTGNKNEVQYTTSIENPNQPITPLLLIPFIENAFKYFNMVKEKQDPITIKIILEDKKLYFTVKNIFNKKYQEEQNDIWKSSGIGIKNTKKRLDILFPNKHDLLIQSENNVFKVYLKIDLS